MTGYVFYFSETALGISKETLGKQVLMYARAVEMYVKSHPQKL